MISKYSAEVFGYVPKYLKRRMMQIRQRDRMWSESRMIKEALLAFVPKIEGLVSSSHDAPRRRRSDAA